MIIACRLARMACRPSLEKIAVEPSRVPPPPAAGLFDIALMLAYGALGRALKKPGAPLAPLVPGGRMKETFHHSPPVGAGVLGVFLPNRPGRPDHGGGRCAPCLAAPRPALRAVPAGAARSGHQPRRLARCRPASST